MIGRAEVDRSGHGSSSNRTENLRPEGMYDENTAHFNSQYIKAAGTPDLSGNGKNESSKCLVAEPQGITYNAKGESEVWC